MGRHVLIFADHVEALTQPSFPSTASVLGYAMAHEIGQVLLRSSTHSSNGLMRGTWSKSDWRAAIFFFEPDEAARMVRSLSKLPHVRSPHSGG